MSEEKTFSYQTRFQTDLFIEEVLEEYATLYGHVERSLCRDLLKGLLLNDLKRDYIAKYKITARQFNACRVSVLGKISAIKESRKQRIPSLKEKIKTLTKKISKIKSALVKHQKKRKLDNLEKRLAKEEKDHKEGNISLCFGGKKLFHSQFHLEENGYSSFEEWKEDYTKERNSEIFCLGSHDETAGNQSCVLTLQDETFCLRLRLPNAAREKHKTKYLLISDIRFVYGKEEILTALKNKQALSYRFKKDEKGWRVFVSFSIEKPAVTTKQALGGIGIDINVNHIALTEIDSQGNPVHKKSIPLSTYGKSKDRAKAFIRDVAKEIVAFAKEKKKPIIAEKLDFTKKKATLKEDNKGRARMLSSFSYSHILESIERRAFKEGVEYLSVSPACTSIIGKIKFSKRYGLTAHHAAALCIARRFFKFSEAPSKCPMKVVHKNVQVTCPLPARNREQHVWVFWIGAYRKLKAALAAHFRVSPGPAHARPG